MIDVRGRTISMAIAFFALAVPLAASAAPPVLRTPGPVIYLAENLDEKDTLGWCIDTLGRGFSEKLQAHSCKPRGGDVQFSFNPATGQLASVAFKGKCVEIVDTSNKAVPFGLLDCAAGKKNQKFSYDTKAREFHPVGDSNLCITVAPTSRTAGPFMSRDLKLEPCANVAPKFKQWIIKP